ncbi:DUF6443 domain-containing protein [Aquimarina sp. AU474]|uniref:DUF6443 domain-containing protein n=1 Tax=Aquimarina sp. AU474 TaxID=2108529 RepID=UPI000D69FC23|nr:DUF6443 domain-containing protein [Aquimarina sp. AU474]
MKNNIYMIVFLLLVGYTAQAQLTDGPSDGGGGTTKYYYDGDGDGYGNPNSSYVTSPQSRYVANKTDCNDGSAAINPTTRWYYDHDGDGRGRTSPVKIQCTKPSGYVLYKDDRDDNNVHITHIAPRNFYRDVDKDGFGNPGVKVYRSVRPSGYVTDNRDCNDNNKYIHPNTVWYRDYDKDGRGNINSTTKSCTKPSGYVSNNDDINDGNVHITNIPPRYFYRDYDKDTFGSPAAADRLYYSAQPIGYVTNNNDCDDRNINIHPNTKWYKDGDGDGRGNAAIKKTQCDRPLGYVINNDDINDGNEFITNIAPKNFYRDGDRDTFGNPNVKFYHSVAPSDGYTYVLNGSDRDDSDEFITNIAPKFYYRDGDRDTFGSPSIKFYRSAAPDDEYTYVLNGSDHDDGNEFITDIAPKNFYRDVDKDTFGNPSVKFYRSTAPDDEYTYVLNGDDCNDGNINIHPNTQWYADGDTDGLGDPNTVITACAQPSGYVLDNTDQCPDEYGEIRGCANEPYTLTLSENENYVYSRTYLEEMTSPSEIKYNKDVSETVTYVDGLGRPKQQIAVKASPTEQDIITHIEYDELGRQTKQYLPFAKANTGAYTAVDINNDINSYYLNTYANDFPGITNPAQVNAYSESIYEDSPLNRVLEQGAPGTAWKANPTSDADHTIKFDWRHNTTNEVVRFDVTFADANNTEEPSLEQDGYYAANELQVTITKDENWTTADGDNHTTREYKDKQGRVLLKRTFNESIPHDTYYVYDDYGNLTYVLPPKVTTADGVSNTELVELCYQYRYDYRNRLIEKKIPGKGWEYIIYNKLDQPVMTQDANLKAQGKWLFTKYDAIGRVTYTGMVTNTSGRVAMQGSADNTTVYKQYETKQSSAATIAGTTIYYSNDAIPQGIAEIHTINYYDDYVFDRPGISAPPIVLGQNVDVNAKSLSTGSKVRVLGTNNWITTGTFYDQKGRPIYIAIKNEYLNTTDIIESELDFAGRVQQTKTTHTKDSNAAIVTIDKFTYDHTGRVTKQTQKIGNQDEELIANNHYDALGQLTSKKVGGIVTQSTVEGLQTVDYSYNIRGWLQGINDVGAIGSDLFSFAIDYNTGSNPLYNGNISKISWQTANDNITRNYSYTYDALNRIKTGISNDNKYNLSNVSYDKMGNILSLNRKGHTNTGATTFGDMDILSYAYDSGNKLLQVTDTGNDNYGFKDGTNTNDDFEYDVNGNMILDRNKGITDITYNHLNLPATVSISNSQGTGTISYIYDATGAKLKKIVTEGSSLINTEYAGNYVYKNGTLEFFNHPEGIVEKEADGYKYVYQYKDHLDNIRLSYRDNRIVYIDNNFDSGLQGWTNAGADQIINENGRLKISAPQKWKGAHIYKYDIPAGTSRASVSMDVDMGTTHLVSITIWQFRADGSYITRYGEYTNQTGFKKIVSDLDPEAVTLRVKVEKSYTTQDDGVVTHFYIDNVVLQNEELTIVQEKNYYPFGLTHRGYNSILRGRNHAYGFTNKEEQDEIGLGWIDITARNYNPELGRWMNFDPATDVLESSSPYVYALNSPIVYLDLDGELPILINGRVGSDLERGNESYWTSEIINTIKGSGIANPGGQFHYVDGDRGYKSSFHAYARGARKGEKYAVTAGSRYQGGYSAAGKDIDNIIAKLERDPETGKITEKIQIYTHSRGGAFGAGYTSRLLRYIKENSELFEDPNNVIDFVLNLAPHQSDSIDSPEGVDAYSIDRDYDMLSGNDMGGLKAAFKSNAEKGKFGESHRIKSFKNDLKSFMQAFKESKGDNSKLIDGFVSKMKEYGIKITVKE